MTEIIPAILPQDFREVEDKMAQVKGIVSLVQIDVCDGKFVPSYTWPYKKHDENFDAILREERGMPFWEDVDFEADLMIKDPEHHILQWVAAGASRIVLHLESTENLDKCIAELKDLVEIGIGIGLETPIEKLAPYIHDIQFVQCMGISKIGFQSQPFDNRVLQKLKDLLAAYPNTVLSVDGGVNLETAPLLIEAGAQRLVVGSALFNSDNIVETIHTLENL
jgi:ribulose-phosphate 3-epimerase